MQLAQVNIAELLHPPGDPRVAAFVDNVALINGLAERADGFVWRLQDKGEVEAIFDNPLMTATLSIWQSPEHLERFVWKTVHKKFYGRRAEWFSHLKSHYLAMWFVEDGERPTLQEGKARLDHLDAHGSTDYAFDWPYLKSSEMWKSYRLESQLERMPAEGTA